MGTGSGNAKILFILPYFQPLSNFMRIPTWAPTNTFTHTPLSIPILAALTPHERFSTSFINEYRGEPVDYDSEVDIVALSFLTASAPRAYEIADNFRRRGKLVVMGGVHVSFCQEEALDHADVVFIGEGEEIWPQFLQDFLSGSPQRVYRAPRPVPPELIPVPDRMITRRHWRPSNISLMATRGCPYSCDFCTVSSHFGNQVRCRPVEMVVEEIKEALALEKGQTRTLVFKDDNIAFNKQYAFELFENLLPLKTRWVAQANVKSFDDPELVKLMARAGGVLVIVGLESAQANHISRYKKSYEDPAKVKEVIARIQRHNIFTWGTYMLGFDDDTPATIKATVRQAIYLGIDIVWFSILTPLPGTALYRQLAAEGRILEKRWEYYDVEHSVFEPRSVSSAQLTQLRFQAIRHFYSGPEIIRRMAKTVMRIIHTGRPVPLFYALYINLASRAAVRHLI